MSNINKGRGSNLSQEDRKKGGELSHASVAGNKKDSSCINPSQTKIGENRSD